MTVPVGSPAPEFEATPGPCPACGAGLAEQRELGHKEGARFVRCASCDLMFVNPRPTRDWLSRRYAYYGSRLFTVPEKLESDFAPGRYDGEIALLRGRHGRLLDVGCATGAFVAAARDAGFDARGIDLSAESTRHGRERHGLALEAGDLTERAYPAGSFEVVTLWATLEHLPEPGAFLTEAHRLLAPGGVVAFSVPNHLSLTQRLLGFRDRYVGIDHLNYFTAATSSRLLARFGFRVARVRTDKCNPIVIWQDLRGRTPSGASVEQQLADQRRTDLVKRGGGAAATVLRAAHRGVTAALGAAGMGDVLYVLAERA